MKVLVLNGSQKGEKSNTLNITKAFLDGFSADTEVEYITVKKETIKPCMGCFSCPQDCTDAVKNVLYPTFTSANKEVLNSREQIAKAAKVAKLNRKVKVAHRLSGRPSVKTPR